MQKSNDILIIFITDQMYLFYSRYFIQFVHYCGCKHTRTCTRIKN